MMFPLVLGWVSLALGAAVPDHRSEARVSQQSAAGYPFGKPFSDAWAIGQQHRRIAEIDVQGCEPGGHMTGMTIIYRDNRNSKDETATVHGSGWGTQEWRSFFFDTDEFIKEVRVTTWDKKVKQFRATVYHTRIGYMKFTTSKNKVYECGGYDGGDPAWTWGGEGKALLYFSGSQGDAMDQLLAHFIPSTDF